jgi:hypothetical protein
LNKLQQIGHENSLQLRNSIFDTNLPLRYFNAEAISCLDNAVNNFCEIGRISMAARYLKVYIAITS